MAGETPPAGPTAEDIAATQAGAAAGETAVKQGLTREEVQAAIEEAISKHNPPNMSEDDIKKVADVLKDRFVEMGAFEAAGNTPPAEPPAAQPPAGDPNTAPPVTPPTDDTPAPGTFADRFLSEKGRK